MQDAWVLARRYVKTAHVDRRSSMIVIQENPHYDQETEYFCTRHLSKLNQPLYKFAISYISLTEVNENVACLQLISHPRSDVSQVFCKPIKVQLGVAEHLTLTICHRLSKGKHKALFATKYPGGFLNSPS